jgi:2-methylcitrate dehydratase PrpD
MKNQSKIVGVLHDFVQRESWSRAGDRVKALAKIHVIDGVAAMMAGAMPPSASAGPLAAPFKTLAGCDPLVCATQSYSYALAGRLSDYDDVQTTETATYGLLGHPTVPVLAAVLAVGQAKRVSGQALLDAYLAGIEISARLAGGTEPMNLANRIAATTTFGGIAALMATAKLLQLTRAETTAAFDLWQLLVPMAPLDYESPTNVAHRDAHSVRIAVEAALNAKRGVRADPTFLGPLSLVREDTASSLSRRLGKPYCILEPGFAIRVYPSNPLTHPAIDATLAIVNVHGIMPTDIERIDVGITRMMMDRLCMDAPSTAGEVRHSLPFAVALAACRGLVDANDFSNLRTDPAVTDMIRRVHKRVDPELDGLGYERARTWVQVTLRNGRAIALKLEVAKGTPQKPLSEVELAHKFLQCALGSMDERSAEFLLNRLWSLDAVSDVSELFILPDELSGDRTNSSSAAAYSN